MMVSSLIFTILYSIIGAASLILGINIIQAGKKDPANRAFFFVCVLLSVWALGFSTANSAKTAAECTVWSRVASVGWSVIYAVIVHFSLAISGRGKLLSKPWVYPLLYLPAGVSVYAFCFSDPISSIDYAFVRRNGIWVNTHPFNGWDIFFYVYLAVYSALALLLFVRLHRKSQAENERKYTKLLLISYSVSIVLGILTDIINPFFQTVSIPQMAPVAFLIPILAVNFGMKKYRLMVRTPVNESEVILNDSTRTRLVVFLSAGMIFGGVLNFITQYAIEKGPLGMNILFSLALIVFGVVILLLQRFSRKMEYTETLLIYIAVIAIPAITMTFIQYASVTIWAFPFAFILLSMLFNNRNLLVATSISVLFTQFIVWVTMPVTTVSIDASDFIVRIGIFALSICIAFYGNSVYVRRLRENAEKNRYQKLVSDVSSSLVSLTGQNRDEKIRLMLQGVTDSFSSDFAFLNFTAVSEENPICFFSWDKTRYAALPVADESLCPPAVSLYLGAHAAALNAGSMGSACADAPDLLAMLRTNGFQSFISHPIVCSDGALGFWGICSRSDMRWREDQADTLKIMTNILSDSFAKLAAEREIEFMAYHDHLTRLPNRLLFSDRAEQAIHLARRTEKQIAVVFLDLDSFKSINDTMGHRAGDDLIREVAGKLTSAVRKSDTVARFGGDEFLVMLNNLSQRSDVARVMDTIMRLFEQPFHLQGQEVFVTASAGIAVYPQDGDTTETLIKNADIAMYNAKDKGKNIYMFCSEDLKEDVQKKVRLTNHLYRALEHKELEVYYQPQVDLQTNRIIGAEALLRWFHPEFGLVSPSTFIPLAEKSGMIGSIGHWVLDEACKQAKHWQVMGLPKIRVAVNISVNQLRNPQFVEQVEAILGRSGLEAKYLELEVTESVAIKESAYIVSLLTDLKKLGVFLSIDDFGTEYSSLSRLKQLPVDRIKIDMQFVQGIDKNDKDKAISKIIINLAKSLGLKVIAEGVENDEQLTYLNSKMCDEVQGFIYYKPMPAREMEDILGRMEAE